VSLLALLHAQASAGQPILIEEGPSGEDSAVYAAFPFLARGDYPTLYAFTAFDGGVDHSFRTFMRFDLSQEIAPGACVGLAELSVIYAFDGVQPPGTGGGGGPVTTPGSLQCRPILSSWGEATATWANQPSVGAPEDVISGLAAFGEYRCDITGMVRGWVDGSLANHGVALFSDTERALGFHSFEANQPADVKTAILVTLADDPQACPEPAWAAPIAILALLSWKRLRS
jgi:hypothetical protein